MLAGGRLPRATLYLDGGARVDDALAAHEAVGHVHGNAADVVVTQVLRHLQHQADVVVLHLKGRHDGGQLARVEAHVNDGAWDE